MHSKNLTDYVSYLQMIGYRRERLELKAMQWQIWEIMAFTHLQWFAKPQICNQMIALFMNFSQIRLISRVLSRQYTIRLSQSDRLRDSQIDRARGHVSPKVSSIQCVVEYRTADRTLTLYFKRCRASHNQIALTYSRFCMRSGQKFCQKSELFF